MRQRYHHSAIPEYVLAQTPMSDLFNDACNIHNIKINITI
ncbi:hypothetical protein YPS_2479 [Yersinia pestis Pestoides A]|nr:hypothetical protein YPS_2479 [Yersinia pestis Pestoides A]EIS95879.1 hypothetical protein YPPY89_2553 [Yersinia pestis PY-89]